MSANNNNGKKPKITIRPFKHQVQMDPNYADKTWKLLKSAVHEIHKQNASGLSFEELYRNAYNMVLHKHGDQLYKELSHEVSEHLTQVADKVSASHDSAFLQELDRSWSDHKISMLMIRDILMYMDRVYVTQHNLPPVYDLGLAHFRDNIARNNRIKERLLNMVLNLIQRERMGEVIERGTLRSLTLMWVDLGINSRDVYEADFERHFLDSTSQFYHMESQDFIAGNSCSDYLRKVEVRLKEEFDRVSHYLDSATEPKLRDVVERELLTTHLRTLLDMENSGLVCMLRDDKVEDLKRMFVLFARVPVGLPMMRDTLSAYIKDTGKSIVMDEEKEKEQGTYVQQLLDLKDKYDRLLTSAFSNDKAFQHSVNQAFESFINLNPKSPEYISLFIDDKLKKGLKGVSDEEIEIVLDKVMVLFRFIQEKDLFEKYYKQHLARRLLLGRSVSDDAERNMIAKLKTECGYQFTSKLEGMFTDMKLSADSMEGFRSHIENQGVSLGGIELNVHVLTTGFWPTQTNANCKLPNEILTCCEVFRKYYLGNHNGRRLTWQTNMGTADIKAQFGAKRHELNVSTYQMVILLQFNDSARISFKDLLEATGMPVPDLKRQLASLYNPKNRLLDKENAKGGATDESDVFMFNSKFKSKLYRVKVNPVAQKETVAEASETRQKVDEDRKHQVEAAIVRIMKARKTMDHPNLVSEVTRQLSARFMPHPMLIKKRIESLIEREYLERSKSDRKVYNYLA